MSSSTSSPHKKETSKQQQQIVSTFDEINNTPTIVPTILMTHDEDDKNNLNKNGLVSNDVVVKSNEGIGGDEEEENNNVKDDEEEEKKEVKKVNNDEEDGKLIEQEEESGRQSSPISQVIEKEESCVSKIPSITTTTTTSLTTTSVSLKLRQEHRLKTRWTFWYLNADRERDWLERLKKVCAIESAEAFWALFDNIRPPSGVQIGCDYNFFKNDIRPVWEVPENKDGGRLIVTIDRQRVDHLDVLWMELLVALIGEQFGRDSDYICGAVCNIRNKGHKICLWTKDAEAEDVNRRIGTILKSRFQDTTKSSIKVNYEEHNVSQHKSSSATQVRFIL